MAEGHFPNGNLGFTDIGMDTGPMEIADVYTRFGSTYTNIGTVQRLARPLLQMTHKFMKRSIFLK